MSRSGNIIKQGGSPATLDCIPGGDRSRGKIGEKPAQTQQNGRPKLGDVLCNRVAEATRKRFYGDGETPYTPPKEPPKF